MIIDLKKELGATAVHERDTQFADEIHSLSGVRDMVLFPDSFTKEKYVRAPYKVSIPSSVAIASDVDVLYPQFRPRGISCGMMTMALPLHKDELTDSFVRSLFGELTYSLPYYLAYRFRLPFSVFRNTYDLDQQTFLKVLKEGASFLQDKYDVQIPNHPRIELAQSSEPVSQHVIDRYLNPDWFTKRTARLRHRFGMYFGGNHYAELQYVDHVDAQAKALGLTLGQVVFSVHTVCNSLIDIIRPDLADTYIRQPEYVQATADDDMYAAFFAGQQVLMNYGQAGRFTTYMIVRDFFARHSSFEELPSIVLSRAHNFTQKEEIGGVEQLVYRHNTERLLPGEYALLSGRYDFPSYIIYGEQDMDSLLYSIDHGVGHILSSDDALSPAKGTVRKMRYKQGIKMFVDQSDIPLVSSPSVDQYLSFMQGKQYFSPQVRLMPVYNMKSIPFS